MNIDDFKNNTSSACDAINYFKNYEFKFCESKMKCGDEQHIKSTDIWGINVGGMPYLRRNKCFYPLHQLGTLSTFYYINAHAQMMPGIDPQFGGTPTGRTASSKLFEKILDTRNGKILDQKRDVKEIIKIIKSDAFFASKKINRKNVVVYITQYNKRHPLF